MSSIAFLVFLFLLPSTSFSNNSATDEDRKYLVRFKKDCFTQHSRRIMTNNAVIPITSIPMFQVEVVQMSNEGKEDLEMEDCVDTIEEDHIISVDPILQDDGYQSAILSATETIPYGIKMVESMDLPDLNENSDMKVCVIDTGYDLGHVDLQEDFVTGFVPSQYPGARWDYDGHRHGTHCSGTISELENNIGYVGVVHNGKLKLHIGKGLQDSGYGYSSAIMECVQNCIAEGAKVISMSLGGGSYSSIDNEMYKSALNDHGVIVVAAAGNSGGSGYSYPASYDSVLSVAAVDSNKYRAHFSQYNDQVDIAAPGVSVCSTMSRNSNNLKDLYACWSGTSMATPHVAGVTALLWSHFPDTPAIELRDAMYETAVDKGDPGRDDMFGNGIVNAKLLYKELSRNIPSTSPNPSTAPTRSASPSLSLAPSLRPTTKMPTDFPSLPPTNYPTVSGAPSIAFSMKLTTNSVSDLADHQAECTGEFGSASKVVDFEFDLKQSDMSDEFFRDRIKALGISPSFNENSYFVTYKGNINYTGQRVFFFEDHDGNPPGNWMVHDTYSGVSLGSWYGINGPVLCLTTSGFEYPSKYPSTTSIPTRTAAPSTAISFALTSSAVSEKADHQAECRDEFGANSKVVDFEYDLMQSGMSEEEFRENVIQSLDIPISYNENNYFVTYEGKKIYDGMRVYFFEDHNGNPPSNWLVHETFAGLSLGSWFLINGHVLCTTDAPTYNPTNTPTRAPTHASTNTPTRAPTDTPTSTPTDACADGRKWMYIEIKTDRYVRNEKTRWEVLVKKNDKWQKVKGMSGSLRKFKRSLFLEAQLMEPSECYTVQLSEEFIKNEGMKGYLKVTFDGKIEIGNDWTTGETYSVMVGNC